MAEKGVPWQHTLRFQFLLVTLIASLFIIGLFVFVQIYVPSLFKKQADKDNLILVRTVALRIDQHLSRMAEGVEVLAQRPDIRSMDTGQQEGPIRIARETNALYNRLYIIDRSGNITVNDPPNPAMMGKNYSNVSYFREPMESGKTYYSDVFVEGQELLSVVSTPIRGPNNEIIGILCAAVSLSKGKLSEFMSGVDVGGKGYAVLVDRGGTLVVHPDQGRVLRQESISGFESVKRVLRGKEGVIICGFDGRDRVCSFAPVKKAGWGLVITRPQAEVYPYLLWIRIVMAIVFLLSAGLVGFFYMHGQRAALAPVAALREGVDQLTAGNFDYRVEIKGQGELTQLASAFGGMVEILSTCYRVTQALNSLASLKDIEKYILDEISRTFKAEACTIMLFDKEDKLKIELSRGIPKKAVEAHNKRAVERKDLEEVFGKKDFASLSKGEALELEKDKVPLLERVVPVKKLRFVYSFPLTIEEELVGMVMAFSSSDAPFTKERVQSVAAMTNHIAVAIQRSDLFDRLYQSYAQTTRAMAQAIDAKDPYSAGHSEGVAKIALQIGKQLGLSSEELRGLEIAAYLHDVGKIGISEELLRKPVKLSLEERKMVQTHPQLSALILSPIEFPWPVLPAIAHHHEQFKGDGYPDKIKGEDIPLEARILAVADAYEAMTSDRPYRSALTKEEAIKELRRESGRQFDPLIVKAWLEVLEGKPVEEKPKKEEKKPAEPKKKRGRRRKG